MGLRLIAPASVSAGVVKAAVALAAVASYVFVAHLIAHESPPAWIYCSAGTPNSSLGGTCTTAVSPLRPPPSKTYTLSISALIRLATWVLI